MALIGGGGAGNVAGGNPSGIGTALNYIGNHVYAFNNVAASASDTVVLRFATGPEYIVGTIQFNGYIQPGNPGTGSAGTCNITFDDQTVINMKTETELETSAPHSQSQNVIIPAFTNVIVTLRSAANESAQFATIGIAGRIYA